MTLKRMSTLDGQTERTRSAVADISDAVKGQRGCATGDVVLAALGSEEKSWTWAAMLNNAGDGI